jgi:CHAD domain-containing protein
VPTAAPRRSRPLPIDLADLPAPLDATPEDPAPHHVRAALDLRLRALLQHDPGTRTGADIEDLHQMRVAVRRMRATLKAARPLLDRSWADGLRAELGWLGRALGPVRDFDVLLLRLRGEAAALPEREQPAGEVLVAALEGEHRTARAEMLAALDAPRYTALLERIADAVRLPRPTPAATEAQPELVDLARREAARLRRAVERAGENPPPPTPRCTRCASSASACATPANWWSPRCAGPTSARR